MVKSRVHARFEVNGSNLGLRKSAYFIKKSCTLIVDGLVVMAGLLGYFFILLFLSFFLIFHFVHDF